MKVDIDSPKWYLAQIKANGFDRAVANLARQGFLTFSPMQNKTVRHARQLKNVLRPIFPGYLFVQFGAERSDTQNQFDIWCFALGQFCKIGAGAGAGRR